MGRPRLLVAALLLRLACACSSDDESKEPSLQPFLDLSVSRQSVTRVHTQTKLSLSVVAEIRRNTYSCSRDTSGYSCSPSQDPDEPCPSVDVDFGPHRGDEFVERVAITKMTAELCGRGAKCTTYDVALESETHTVGDPEWESTYAVVLPIEDSGICPSLRVEYDSSLTGPSSRIFNVDGSCRPEVADASPLDSGH
jgi:hypothetical protein